MLNYNHHDEKIKNVVSVLVNSDSRIRLFLMDNTGYYIPEEYDTMGYIRKTSNGYPLLVNNRRSLGGGLFPNNVGKIIDTKTKKVLFVSSKFKMGFFNLFKQDDIFCVSYNDTIIAIFKEQEKAIKFIAFIKGERNNK